MKKLLLLIFTLLSGFVNAQEKYKNELGIGIGSMEYNSSSAMYSATNQNGWSTQIFFLQSEYHSFISRKEDIHYEQNLTLPVLYYSTFINSRSTIRSSFQFMYQKGRISNEYFNIANEPVDLKFQNTKYALTIGSSYSFFKSKFVNVYAAGDLEVAIEKFKKNEVRLLEPNVVEFESIYFPYVIESNFVRSSSFQFNPIISLGLKAPLLKRTTLSFECSAKLDDGELILRPLHRLSIDYLF